MKKLLFHIFILFLSTNFFAQNGWNEVWNLQEVPFQDPTGNSDFARVLAGFDSDEDGWGEFLTGYTDYDTNYIFMYEATGDNAYEMVWHYKFPLKCDTRYAAAVSDIDHNGKVELIIGWPSLVDNDNLNPPRVFTFEWNGTVGENNYGRDNGDGTFNPTHQSKMDLPDNTEWNPYSMVVEDVDKDGKDELILGIRSGGRGREVLVASVTGGDLSGFGRFQIEYNFQNTESGSNYCTTVGDLDNDGLIDIVEVIWWRLTLRMFEATGENTYEHVNDLDQVYGAQGIDYGSVDGAKILDLNGDGKNEFVMAGSDDAAIENELFIIQNVTDISAITADDVVSFYTFPKTVKPNGLPITSGLRNMDVGDPDNDGKTNLLICGGENGLIYDLEYKGEGDLADSSSWDLNVIYNSYEIMTTELGADSASQLSPRHYFGSIANDMDGDGLSEFVFTNYSTDKNIWPNDIYISILEAENATGVRLENSIIPEEIKLSQNYPNPFNPTTTIKYSVSNSAADINLVVMLKIYDLLGREIKTLVNANQPAGNYEVVFNAADLTSGVYYYILKVGDFLETKKMLLLK